jgi:AcrR family transcriptional regulator
MMKTSKRVAPPPDVRSAPRPALRPTVERGPTELQRLQKRTSHEKLLEAAYLSFAELTYAATTIDHIVRRAEVNRSTFYRHFDSKFAVARALFAEFWPRLFAEFDRLSSSDPSEAEIEEWIGGLLVFYREHKPLYLTLGQIPLLEPEGARWEENVRTELLTRLGTRIPAFRRATSKSEATSELRVRARIWMTNFEHIVFFLAFGDDANPDRPALLAYIVRETREFIAEEAGPA